MVVFRVLGGISVERGSQRRVIRSRLRQVLLGMLLTRSPHAVTTDRIMDALWPDEAPDVARNRLWFHASKLRAALADVGLAERLETHEAGYRTLVSGEELDATAFSQDAARGRALLESDPAAAAIHLERALERWSGNAFGDAGDHPALSADVVRLETLRIGVGEDLADCLIRTTEYEAAIELLRSLLPLDRYRERVRSQLMHALYAAGRQVEALQLYDDSVALLREDLGLDPSPMLRAMGMRILRQDPTLLPSAQRQRPQVAATPRSRFVGRAALVDRLAAQAGPQRRSVAALVSGEAGTGKTTLLGEAAERAAAAQPNLLVAAGVGAAAPGVPDVLGPFRQVLGALVGDLESSIAVDLVTQRQADALWDATSANLNALVEVGPTLIGTVLDPAAVQSRAAAVGWERQSVIDAALEQSARTSAVLRPLLRQIVATLSRIASDRPLLVVLDDLHRADRATIEVVAAIARGMGVNAPFVLGAFRPEEHLPAGWNGLLAALRDSPIIDLDDVGDEERRAFVDALVDLQPNELDDDFRGRLTVATAGRALFVVEWLHSLERRGDLVRSPEGTLRAAPHPDFTTWPQHLGGVIADRLSRLGDDGLTMLRAAAVEGNSFTADVVAQVAGREPRDVIDFLSARGLTGPHVVSADAPSQLGRRRVLRYRFTHQLFRHYLYGSLDPNERIVLHERVGRALEHLGADVDDAQAHALAEHFTAAGIADRAAHYLHVAADRHLRNGDNQGAIDLLNEALDLLAPLSADEKQRLVAAIQLSRGVALSALHGFTGSQVEAAFKAALDGVRDADSKLGAMRAYWGLCATYLSQGDFERADAVLDAMRNDLEAGEQSEMPFLHVQWSLELFRGNLTTTLQLTRRARELYRFRTHHHLTFEYGNHDPGVCAASLGGLTHALRGEFGLAEQWMADARELAASLEHPPSASQTTAFSLWIRHIARDYAGLLEAAPESPPTSAPLWDVMTHALTAHAVAATGGHSATTALAAVLDDQLSRHDAVFGGVVGTLLASEWLRLGAPARAQATLQRCRASLAGIDSYFWLPEMLRLEGVIAIASDDRAAGLAVLERSIESADAMGAEALAARTRHDLSVAVEQRSPA